MSIFNRIIRTVVNEAADSVGDAIGEAVGDAVEKVTDQAAQNIVNDMKRDNEVKDIQIGEQRRMSEIKMEQEYKKTQLPSQCPFCKAPTTGSLVCEYCNSKIM